MTDQGLAKCFRCGLLKHEWEGPHGNQTCGENGGPWEGKGGHLFMGYTPAKPASTFQPWREFQPDTQGKPHGWIQWKGTAVCMDLHCKCGALGHIDAEFCCFAQCGNCGQVYEVSGHVEMRPIDAVPKGDCAARRWHGHAIPADAYSKVHGYRSAEAGEYQGHIENADGEPVKAGGVLRERMAGERTEFYTKQPKAKRESVPDRVLTVLTTVHHQAPRLSFEADAIVRVLNGIEARTEERLAKLERAVQSQLNNYEEPGR